jgi:predicted tellurium resistance membrane protein TerC
MLEANGPSGKGVTIVSWNGLRIPPTPDQEHEVMPTYLTEWIVPLLTLTVMEIVLGIDNVIFIAMVAGGLPANQQCKGRQLGMALALGTRLLLLLSMSWLLGLNAPLFTLSDLGVTSEWARQEISLRDMILIAGGLFLLAKTTYEIHEKLEGTGVEPIVASGGRFGWTLAQIAILDIVFSLDSVITAIGMAQHVWTMVAVMIIAVGVMLAFAGAISSFVHRHPTMKMLALCFMILIGVMLVAEGLGKHIERGYLYFAMAFALVVELLNMRLRKQGPSVQLHESPPSEVDRRVLPAGAPWDPRLEDVPASG